MGLLCVRRTTVLVIALMGLATDPAEARDWSKLKIATLSDYPPFLSTTPNGALEGLEVDLAADLCKRMKVDCEWVVVQDFNTIIPGLTAGKYDAIVSRMAITPKRLAIIDFSLPYLISRSSFGVLATSPLANLPDTGKRVSLDDDTAARAEVDALAPVLRGKVAGVLGSSIQGDVIRTNFKGLFDLRTYPSVEESVLDLRAGRIDVILAGIVFIRNIVSRPGNDAVIPVGPIFTGGLLGPGGGVGLRKTDPELKAMFDTAVRAAIDDGTLRALSPKWLKEDATPQK